MLQEESGPWAIFEKWRAKIWQRPNTSGSFREGYFCFYCMSVWIGILLALIAAFSLVLFYIITTPLAISALAIFINDFRNEDH